MSTNKKIIIISILYGTIVGFLAYLVSIVHLTKENLTETYAYIDAIRSGDIISLLLFIFFAVAAGIGINFFVRKTSHFSIENRNLTRKQFRMVWCLAAVCLVLCWLPWFLTYYPGSVSGDAFTSIWEAMTGNYSNYQSFVYTFFVGVCVKLGVLLGFEANECILVYTIFQYIVLSTVISYVIARLYKSGVHLVYLIGVLIYYAIAPFFPLYAVTMWKDPMFSAALLILGFSLYDLFIADSDGKLNSLGGNQNCVKCTMLCIFKK